MREKIVDKELISFFLSFFFFFFLFVFVCLFTSEKSSGSVDKNKASQETLKQPKFYFGPRLDHPKVRCNLTVS